MKLSPGDPVRTKLPPSEKSSQSKKFQELRYNETVKLLGLDKPTFYFSLSSQAYPDTIYKVLDYDNRRIQKEFISHYGNWPQIETYYQTLKETGLILLDLPDSIAPALQIKVKSDLGDMFFNTGDKKLMTLLNRMEQNIKKNALFQTVFEANFKKLKNKYLVVKREATPERLYFPDFKWYGFDNQYHNWLKNFVSGELGKSYVNQLPISTKLKPAIQWTLMMSLAAIFIAYIVAIPLGVLSAVKKDSLFDRGVSLFLFMLFSLPVFWVGTLCLMLFTNNEYGMDWFDGTWSSNLPSNAGFWARFWDTSNQLVLPILCLSYSSFAYLARQMRGGMLDVFDKLFIQTARAKGLKERTVIWKHGLRNALFPIITIFASVFPRAIAGSVVLEYIFNIPGMGWETLEAISEKDWPVVFAILLLGAVLTMIGILVADIFYALADPRISYKK
ncbi:MAG: peptide/nickel transport system permease protein [Saprospiraceae bacterium]|jgi:peptide/nickel transport system permease protein